jgi:membrane fusion protein, heavy metal efflux system
LRDAAHCRDPILNDELRRKNMRASRFPLWIVATLVVLTGCRDGGVDDQGHDHEAGVLQLTAWSPSHEIFIEFAPLVAGVASELLTHVTDLAGGVPVTDGPLAYQWTHAQGQVVEIDTPAPSRDGLYITATTLPEPGLWTLAIRAPGTTEPVTLPEIRVYGNTHAAEHAPLDPDPEAVVLLKEQQWRFGVMSAPLVPGTFVPSVEIAAVAEAQPDRRTVVSTPVAGRLAPNGGRAVAAPGTRVDAGDVLGVIHAPVAGDGADLAQANVALVRAESTFALAEAEVERARTLYAAEAAPARRVREAEAALAEARADRLAARQLSGANNGGSAPELPLYAPIDGLVVDVTAAVGEYVAAGAPVFTVLDPAQLWVRGWIPESALTDLPDRPAAMLVTPGGDDSLRDLPSDDLIYLAPELDARTRSASIVYAIDNTDGRLRVGQSLSLRLRMTRAENALTIPIEALVDEQGRPVVFVQTGGETFAKRPLVLGEGDGRRQVVESGLTAGDRVVISGAWAVKLASADDVTPAHGHAH